MMSIETYIVNEVASRNKTMMFNLLIGKSNK